MDSLLCEKYNALKERIRSLECGAVAFSGGVDSSLLVYVAKDVLGDHAFAVTARSPLVPLAETDASADFCREYGVKQLFVEHNDLSAFCTNPPDRCYICKKQLFSAIFALAGKNGARYVLEGSNLDDEGDYRPGMRAVAELGALSPLRECGFTKADIRAVSRELGLPTADKPSAACLASRFAYGELLAPERLAAVEQGETFLRSLGFGQLRLRVEGSNARIELVPEEIGKAVAMREKITAKLAGLGFVHISLDLRGYRTGSMNEGVKQAP